MLCFAIRVYPPPFRDLASNYCTTVRTPLYIQFLHPSKMPTTKKCGQETAANKAIGGVPNLHYFDFKSRGRGQVVRLLWEDAEIAYEDTRYSFEEYPEYKKTCIAEMNPTSNIPVIELNGHILTQSYAILRHFARRLGKYDGDSEEAKYWADAMCDIVIDCTSPRTQP